MSLLIQRMYHQGRGLGGTTWGTFQLPTIDTSVLTGANEESVDGPAWWQVLIPTAGQTISNVLAPWQATAAQASSRQPVIVNSPIPTANPNSGAIGFGIDGLGLRLSDGSHIGWLPIAAIVAGFMLLQSRGFSRR